MPTISGYVEVAGYSSTDLQNSYDAGYADGYDDCKDDLEEITITESGTYDAEQLGKVGFDVVNVEVSGGNVDHKTITENGVYNASDDELDGYDEVTVNVPAYAYVEPQVKDLTGITSNNSKIIMSTYFHIDTAQRVRFCSTLNFITANISSSATLTVLYGWDNTQGTPITQTYTNNGSQILTLDFLLPELAAGDHVFSVAFGIVGGDIS